LREQVLPGLVKPDGLARAELDWNAADEQEEPVGRVDHGWVRALFEVLRAQRPAPGGCELCNEFAAQLVGARAVAPLKYIAAAPGRPKIQRLEQVTQVGLTLKGQQESAQQVEIPVGSEQTRGVGRGCHGRQNARAGA
jgi:hypothetical protein